MTRTDLARCWRSSGPVLLFLFALLGVAAKCGCRPANTPREQVRSVVLTVAEGVRVADEACASVARAKRDLPLADACAAIVVQARDALLAAEEGVDAWGSAAAGDVPCAVRNAAGSLSRILETIKSAGGKPPPAVEDALRLAPMLAGVCHG